MSACARIRRHKHRALRRANDRAGAGRLRCPLAADHHEIALRQEPIEIPGAAELAESRWQGPVWVRVAAGADDPHAEGGAEFTDIEPDSAGAHDARSLTFQ